MGYIVHSINCCSTKVGGQLEELSLRVKTGITSRHIRNGAKKYWLNPSLCFVCPFLKFLFGKPFLRRAPSFFLCKNHKAWPPLPFFTIQIYARLTFRISFEGSFSFLEGVLDKLFANSYRDIGIRNGQGGHFVGEVSTAEYAQG